MAWPKVLSESWCGLRFMSGGRDWAGSVLLSGLPRTVPLNAFENFVENLYRLARMEVRINHNANAATDS